MKGVVAKLTDAEARLLNDCLCIAIEHETLAKSSGGEISEEQAELGRRIINLSLRLGIETGWDNKHESIYKRYRKNENEI